MPNYTSSFHPDVDYNATVANHALIEEWLGNVRRYRGEDRARNAIFVYVKQLRFTKGKTILEQLARNFPDEKPEPDTDDWLDLNALYAALGAPTSSTIYDHMIDWVDKHGDTFEPMFEDAIDAKLAEEAKLAEAGIAKS